MRLEQTRIVAAVVAAVSLACLAACEREDECSNEGEEWCAKNTPHRCYEATYPDPHDAESEATYLAVGGGIRCDHYGATCVEESNTSAYCVFTDVTCTSGVPSMCVGTVIAECGLYIHPLPDEDCADQGLVCSTDGPGLGAECVSP
jgi:hypothetical protein